MRNRRGFSLLEIIIVLVIISIIMAMALPNLRNPGSREALTTSARDLMSASALARQQAISSEAPVRIRFNAESRVWRIVLPAEEETKRKSRSRKNDDVRGSLIERDHPLPAGVKLTRLARGGSDLEFGTKGERLPEITFYPTGSSNGIVVEFTGKDDRKATVAIAQSTGKPRTWKGGMDEEFATANKGEEEQTLKHIGPTSEERVASYKRIAERLVADQRRQYEMQQSGLSEAEFFAQKESDREADKP